MATRSASFWGRTGEHAATRLGVASRTRRRRARARRIPPCPTPRALLAHGVARARSRRRHFLLITLIVMSTITALIYASVLPRHLTVERSVGLGLSVLALVALMCTAMSDPGIYPRHSKPLEDSWTYSEYAQSYRPAGVIYCQQCQVLIEEYNHFCPWSGIVIGKGNEPFFQVFITSTVLALLYDVVIVSMILHGLAF